MPLRPAPVLAALLCAPLLWAAPASPAAAQHLAQALTVERYTGRVGERPVTMYVQREPAPCGGDAEVILAAYRYDGVSEWLQLNAQSDRQGHLALVESNLGSGVSGAMMLTRRGQELKGKWISPDGERVLPVQLKQAKTSAADRQAIQDALDKISYDNNDC